MDQKLIISLSRCRLFCSLQETTLAKLLDEPGIRRKTYSPGAVIHQQGDPYSALDVLISGRINTTMHDANGKTMRLERISAPDVLAPGFLFAADNALPVTISAESGVMILEFRKSALKKIGEQHPEFLFAYLEQSGNRIVGLAKKLRFSHFNTIRQKAAHFLLEEMHTQRSSVIVLTNTKEFIAEFFGVSRPALSRVLSELCREGIIRQQGRTVTICNEQILRELVVPADAHGSGARR